jgi:hypothetical protein
METSKEVPAANVVGKLNAEAFAAGDTESLPFVRTKPGAVRPPIGAIDAGGPTVGVGMLFVNSGYGLYGGQAGNVLIAFRPAHSRQCALHVT